MNIGVQLLYDCQSCSYSFKSLRCAVSETSKTKKTIHIALKLSPYCIAVKSIFDYKRVLKATQCGAYCMHGALNVDLKNAGKCRNSGFPSSIL